MSDSLPVVSNQTGVHKDLAGVVRKHLTTPFLRPIPPWVDALASDIVQAANGRPLILDSGCGTGHSTLRIAAEHPDCMVIGLDQSANRLRKNPLDTQPPGNVEIKDAPEALNLRFIRADAQDIWRALLARGVTLHAHYLLYPNPWPKAHHLMRRWHAHPVWPSLMALGGRIELRTNWEIYAREFYHALELSGASSIEFSSLSSTDAVAQPMSLFEKKYAASGHALWQVRAFISPLEPN